ncbi:MAG: HPr family phosphocarrier protein [Gammaproteobacteria bacterium]|nr:HPr family phosphocarrier protein [Gammaproteobacteria bacterium]
MVETTVVVRHEVGLHARPAAIFVKAAQGFDSSITLTNLTRGSDPVDAKSIISVFRIAVAKNHEVRIQADGPDEEAAISTLKRLVESNFEE